MIKHKNYISGSGGGGGGGGSASEDPNTLKSVSYARIIDLLSAGEIKGLVNGLQSVELDGVPIMNEDGSYNFENVNWEFRSGTIQQELLTVIDGAETVIDVGAELKYNAPIIREISDENADYARVTLQVSALYQTDTDDGDMHGSSVTMRIEFKPNGGNWTAVNPDSTRSTVNTSSISGYDEYIIYGKGDTAKVYQWWDGVNEQTVTKNVNTQFDIQYKIGGGDWETASSVQYSKSISLEATVKGSGAGTSTLYSFRVVATPLDTYDEPAAAEITAGYGIIGINDITIDGKTTSAYQRDIQFKLDGDAPWQVRVTRLTEDSTSSYVQNATGWAEMVYINQKKFTYPLSALFALSIDATQFSQVPTRSYDCYGKIIKLPSNYDPYNKVYSGDWDGTFKMDWSDNPAWITYDLLLDDINGLGNYISADMLDKWVLYDIGVYCDELVPDGYGSVEPRYTCNMYMQDRDDAQNWLIKFAGIYQAMIYWGARGDSLIQISQDSPRNPVYNFSNSNVSDDGFEYQGSARSTRYNAVYVTWNDPANDYKQATEYVEYKEGINRESGVIYSTQIIAYGCTSRGQARRKGLWYCFTSYEQSEVVTFSTGREIEGLPAPAEVINIYDEFRAGVRMSGRCLSGSTTRLISLDAPFVFDPSQDYDIEIILSDGTIEKQPVLNKSATAQLVAEVSTPFSQAPAVNSLYAISTTNVEPQEFRVITVTDNGDGSYKVSALEYNSSKFDFIENGAPYVEPSTSIDDVVPAAVSSLSFTEIEYQPTKGALGFKLNVSWPPLKNAYVRGYVVSYLSPNSSNWITLPEISTPSIDIDNVVYGTYTVSVAGVSVLGAVGAKKTDSYAVKGMYTTPKDLTGFNIIMKNEQAILSWDKSPDLIVTNGGYIHVRHSNNITGATWSNSLEMTIPISGDSTQVTVPLLSGTYMIRPISAYGVYSDNPSIMETNEAVVEKYNVVETWNPFPDLSGDFIACEIYDNGALRPMVTGYFDRIDNWPEMDLVEEMDLGVTPTYAALSMWTSSAKIDLGELLTSRITATPEYDTFVYGDDMDTWLDVDTRPDWDGQVADCNLQIWVSCTDDDPNSDGAKWRDWQRFFTGDWKARGFRFRIIMSCGSIGHGIELTDLNVVFDMPDRVISENNYPVEAAGSRITFTNAFLDIPAIGITLLNANYGDSFTVTNKTAEGFNINIYNNAGTGISGEIDFIAKGYGTVPNAS